MILITAKVHPYLIQQFEHKGTKYNYSPDIHYDDVLKLIPNATGLVVTTRIHVDQRMIDAAEKLKWIGRLGSGLELIDTEYAKSKGITCISTPEGNRNAVAEHALGMLLNLTKHIRRGNLEVQHGEWIREENRGIELYGKTVGIIGYGNTGRAFAELLSSFKVTVLAYDKYVFDFGKGLIKEANLEQVCRYSDVISFHVPLTSETRHMANDEFFNMLDRTPYFLNTSRGPVVDTSALIRAIQTGKIKGAGIDVLENERISSLSEKEKQELSFLANHPDVVLTPHIAGYSHEAFYKMSETLIKKLKSSGFL